MLYKKPPNVTYTQMAMYIDSEIHKEDCNEELCFEYMWHLFYILAVKGRMFLTGKDYDEYALYGATQLFLRYKKEKDPATRGTLTPIKSSLNYIKRILYPLKVNYQKATFNQIFKEESLGGDSPLILQADASNKAKETYRSLLTVEYSQYISEICSTIRNFLKSSPYYKNKSLRHNIYLSCLLTLLKTMTVSNRNKERITGRKGNRPTSMLNLVDNIYAEERKDSVVLYHLDPSMGNYISTLVNEIKKEVAKDLRFIVGSNEPPDQVVKDILISPIEEYIDRSDNN